MKRIFYLVIIIGLPILIFFQYDRYRRFHPPQDYAFPLNDSIDVHYHDPEMVLKYYETAEQCATYARYCWREARVDVLRHDPYDPEHGDLVRRYQQMTSLARFLEGKLLASARLKAQGFSPADIREWEQQGISPTLFRVLQQTGPYPFIQVGEEGSAVMAIQRLLKARGRPLQVDGIFDQETQSAIIQAQEGLGLEVNGVVDRSMLEALTQ